MKPQTLSAFAAVLVQASLHAVWGADSVVITAPKGGETWAVDSLHHLTWQSDGETTIKLEYSADDGDTWHDIAQVVSDAGRFLWKIPNNVSETCRVRTVSKSDVRATETTKSFSIIPSQRVADYVWTNVTHEAAFAPRNGSGALTFRNRMWLIGGWNPRNKELFPRNCNNDVWSSRDGATWSRVKRNTFQNEEFRPATDWEGRHCAGYVVFKNKMWIVGGDVNQRHYQFDVWNSADGASWTFVNEGQPVPWGPRSLHYTLVYQDRIWIMGGQTIPPFAPDREVFYRDVWNTTDGIHWKKLTPQEPYWSSRGMIGGSTVFRNRMWILGGGTYDTETTPERTFYNDVWSSADGVRWTRHVELAPWPSRQFHNVAVFDNRLWVLAGYTKPRRELNDVWYSSDGVNWYQVPRTPWRMRHAASVFVHSGALWMACGPTNRSADVWKLQRASE